MIEVKNIKKCFNDTCVLDGFNARFDSDSVNFLIGKSGVGKTSLLRIILGLDSDFSGEVFSNGSFSAVFQENALCKNMSVYKNLKLVNSSISESDLDKKLNQLGLFDCLFKKVDELSGGMKRRVSILRSLIVNFDNIIMDEPFKGLDDNTKEIVMDFVINNISGKTAIIVTHDIREYEFFSKKVKTKQYSL